LALRPNGSLPAGTGHGVFHTFHHHASWRTEPYTSYVERSSARAGLASQAARLVATPDGPGHGGQRGRRQSVDDTGPRSRPRGAPSPASTRGPTATVSRPTRAPARAVASRACRLWLAWRAVDLDANRPPHPHGMWPLVPSAPCRPCVPGSALESAKAGSPRPPARRRRDDPVARRHLAGHETGAAAQEHTICFIDESGFYPLPSVGRTDAPGGPTPILREWWTREHLSAISAISPEGTRYFHSQDHALNADAVVAFLAHLRREVPRQMVIIWDGSPLHRSRTMQQCLSHGASPRLHRERLPAYAPELNPDAGVWQQLTGVELRNLCCLNIPHLRREVRDAVKRVRRKPRLIQSFFRGARL
jgi:transposase